MSANGASTSRYLEVERKFDADESAHMVHDLNAILDYVAQLNELDTAGVAPLAQISELEGAGGSSAPRPDTREPSLDRAVVMPQAPESTADKGMVRRGK